ncbi:MAG TPA: dockerin type I domain-containing protein, partial [Chthoniobacterales bacterium]
VDLPITGTTGVECRSGGAAGEHLLVWTFGKNVNFTTAALTSGTGAVSAVSGNGGRIIQVQLRGRKDAQNAMITLFNLTDGTSTTNLSVPLSLLVGDANGDRVVNSADVTQMRNRSGQNANGLNFRSDFNVDGFINSADATAVRSLSGNSVP